MSTTDDAPQDAHESVIPCEDEPIRIPGSVQPHGVLLAVRGHDLTIQAASRSAATHLGWSAERLLGRRLGDVLGATAVGDLRCSDEATDPRRIEPTLADGTSGAFDLLSHRVGELTIVELEAALPAPGEAPSRMRTALRSLQAAGTIETLTAVLATEVRRVTGFDRVMVYRFDADWNGEVVAEDAREDLDPFLGLHYPASDIPAQARALYTSQWMRSIPDARYTPSPLIPSVLDGQPVDLSGSALRSVSPVHLQYLDNMGVRASMSVSIVVNGQLWGLIACHHYAGPHFPSATARGVAEFLGRTASVLVQGKLEEARHLETLAITAASAQINRALAAQTRQPLETLTHEDAMLELFGGATGGAVRIHGELRLLGATPAEADIVELYRVVSEPGLGPFASSSLARDLAGAGDDVVALAERLAPTASGVLLVPLGRGEDFVAWFRPEVLREVHWAGDPEAKGFEQTDAGLRLTPRASFNDWVERVRGMAQPWLPAEVAAGQRLAQDVAGVISRRAAEGSRIAAALQRIVLTEHPQIPAGYTLASRYLPSGRDYVGGDWYDVTVLEDGRVVFMVGDVAGHGMSVAAITAQLRHALRALLVREDSAAAALRQLGALSATLMPGEFATVSAAELDPATGRVRVSSAGHLPALRVRADGTAAFLDRDQGPALGLGMTAEYGEVALDLEPGDAVVLFSDGLVEERRTSITDSLATLRARAAEIGPDPEALCEGLIAAGPVTPDDVTILAFRRD